MASLHPALEALTRVYLGHVRLADATHGWLVHIEGDRQLAGELPKWLGVSRFAAEPRLRGEALSARR